MAWSYSGDPSASPKDAVRFLVQDTNPTDQLVQDAEIQWTLVQSTGTYSAANITNNTAYLAAVKIARSIAAKFSREVDKQVGDLRIAAQQKAKQYFDLATQLQADVLRHAAPVPYAGGISKSDKESNDQDDDNATPSFWKGMNDDPGTAPNFGEFSDGGGFSRLTPS